VVVVYRTCTGRVYFWKTHRIWRFRASDRPRPRWPYPAIAAADGRTAVVVVFRVAAAAAVVVAAAAVVAAVVVAVVVVAAVVVAAVVADAAAVAAVVGAGRTRADYRRRSGPAAWNTATRAARIMATRACTRTA